MEEWMDNSLWLNFGLNQKKSLPNFERLEGLKFKCRLDFIDKV